MGLSGYMAASWDASAPVTTPPPCKWVTRPNDIRDPNGGDPLSVAGRDRPAAHDMKQQGKRHATYVFFPTRITCVAHGYDHHTLAGVRVIQPGYQIRTHTHTIQRLKERKWGRASEMRRYICYTMLNDAECTPRTGARRHDGPHP